MDKMCFTNHIIQKNHVCSHEKQEVLFYLLSIDRLTKMG